MANELVQGLLQSLLQPQQGPNPADIAAALSSRTPVATMAAMQAPQLGQMFGQQFRGLIGGITGKPPMMTADQAMRASLQQVAAQPDLMNSSAGLNRLAQAASAVGRTAEAMQFSLMASQKKMEEEQKAKEEQQRAQDITRQGLGVATSVSAITNIINSLDPEKDAKYIAELSNFANQVASGVIAPDKVQPGLTSIANRNKQEVPKVFEFSAEWEAWKQGQAQGADTSYPTFLTWKANLTRQDSEYQTWLRQNPNGSIEDYWKAKEAATSTPAAPATPRAVPTPTQNEEQLTSQWIKESLRVPGRYWGTNVAVSTDDRPRLATLISNEAAKIKAEQGGTFQDALTLAATALRNKGIISVDTRGTISISPSANPFASAESFFE